MFPVWCPSGQLIKEVTQIGIFQQRCPSSLQKREVVNIVLNASGEDRSNHHLDDS